jgi:transcription elongation factor GreA
MMAAGRAGRSGVAVASLRPVPENTNMTTAAGLQALHAELEGLEGDGRRAIAERIKTAREWGDLSENSEYHDAKNDQAHLETKIARLRERIAGAVVVEEAAAGGDVVGFGSTVVVRADDGGEQTWRIVSSHDASPRDGRLSADSPVAAALLGRVVGDHVSVALPRGERRLTVLSVA